MPTEVSLDWNDYRNVDNTTALQPFLTYRECEILLTLCDNLQDIESWTGFVDESEEDSVLSYLANLARKLTPTDTP